MLNLILFLHLFQHYIALLLMESGVSVAEWCAPTSCITRNVHEVAHEIDIFNHISLFCAGDVTKNSLSVSATSLWSLIILSLSLRIIWRLFFCLRVWIKGQIVLQNFLWSVNFSLQSFLKCSCTALLLMLTTLFLIIIVFIPPIEFYKSALVRM